MDMNMNIYQPTTTLRPFIKTYIIIETEMDLENLVLPDASMVMAIRFKGNVSFRDTSFEYILPHAVLSGIRQSPRHIRYSKGSGNILVIFNPGAASAFFEEPLHELHRQSVDLDHLHKFKGANELSERLCEAKDNFNRIAIVEQFLISKLNEKHVDAVVRDSILKIYTETGNARIKEIASSVHLSQDAFEKRFRKTVGASPKQFSTIVRLRNAIRLGSESKSLTDVAYESGYFDQSHFIKDFKLFAGQPPRKFFASARYW